MKPVVLALILSVGALSTPAQAGTTIQKACMSSDRSAASRELCSCIQRVADAVLTPGEQNRGAKLFADPNMSQELRVSERRADVAFWQKWQSFSTTAGNHCQ